MSKEYIEQERKKKKETERKLINDMKKYILIVRKQERMKERDKAY